MFIRAILLTATILLTTQFVQAAPSARRCMVLPVRDSVGGAIGFEVFKKIELYLKSSRWCYYQYNSEIINILSNYKKNLDQALENDKVLKLVSDKTNAGSLIKVKIESLSKGVNVSITIFGANGRDVYFQEDLDLNSDDPEVIAQTVNNWLDQYEKSIPYDGRVLGVLGQQFSIDIGRDSGVYNEFEVKVVRPIRKRKHPLLKEVVDWETINIATAKIVHVGESQSQVKILKYEGKNLIQPEDWVIVNKNTLSSEKQKILYEKEDERDEYSFGKLGELGIAFAIGGGSNNNSSSAGTKAISGVNLNLAIDGEVWITRKYWLGLDLEKGFGSYTKKEGNLANNSNTYDSSILKLMAGYKYLPMGYFYGPQVDLYFGYASYGHGFDNQIADNFTTVTFSGFLLGVKGSMPINKGFRAYFQFDFIIGADYEEDVTVFGNASDTTNLMMEVGATYKYSPTTDIYGGINYVGNKAEFSNSGTRVAIKNTSLKGGVKFNF